MEKKDKAKLKKSASKRQVVEEQSILIDGEIRIEVPKTVVKRDGRVVPFEINKIERAIKACFNDCVLARQVFEQALPFQAFYLHSQISPDNVCF